MVENIKSREAFDLLKEDEHAVLIDVRTNKEHSVVGIPDLREIGKKTYIIEWRTSILPGSRKRFLNDFENTLIQIQSNPYIFQLENNYRNALLDIFPYLVIF